MPEIVLFNPDIFQTGMLCFKNGLLSELQLFTAVKSPKKSYSRPRQESVIREHDFPGSKFENNLQEKSRKHHK